MQELINKWQTEAEKLKSQIRELRGQCRDALLKYIETHNQADLARGIELDGLARALTHQLLKLQDCTNTLVALFTSNA